jgi:hypothetical protein
MKRIFIFIFIWIGVSPLHAQTNIEPIKVTNTFWGLSLEQGDQKLSLKQARDIMQGVPEAALNMKKAGTNNTIANILGVVGGASIGWTLGTAIGGGEPEWALAGIGAGLIIAAIPLSVSAVKHTKTAAALYNESVSKTGYHRLNIKMKLSTNRVGLVVNF